MKHLSLTSKMTITVALLFILWWSINEYQSYRFAVQLETQEFITDHYVSNQLGIDAINDFVMNTQEDIDAIELVLTHFPTESHRQVKDHQASSYFLDNKNKFIKYSINNAGSKYSKKLTQLLKGKYLALLIQDSNHTQLLSKAPLSQGALNAIAHHLAQPSAERVSWLTLADKSKRYALALVQHKSRRLGFLIDLNLY